MECLVLLTVVVAIIAVIGMISAGSRTRGADNVYWQLAKKHGGSCMPGGWFGKPKVRFPYVNTNVLVDIFQAGRANYTQVQIHWPDADFRCEVFPLVGGTRDRRFSGMSIISTDNVAFDREYIVSANDIREAKNLFTNDVQHAIHRLRSLTPLPDIYMSIRGGTLLVRKVSILRKYHDLDQFVQSALDLYDRVLETQAAGIEFVDRDDMAQLIDEAICQICGEDVVSEMVICRQCKTPHHLDCWQYYGSCSTYACQETRYVVPKMAKRMQS